MSRRPDPSEGLGFARSALVRHSAERAGLEADPAALDPLARIVVLLGDVPLLRRGEDVASALLTLEEAAAVEGEGERLFLGRVGGAPVFAQAKAASAELYREHATLQALDLRSVAIQGAVPPEELGLLATAKSLLFWHARHGFCAHCGSATRLASGGFRRDCPSCGTQHFPRTDPVVIMLVTRGDRCLLGRQSRFPPGVFSCLAGFLEPGETIEDAVRREVHEEAGVAVGPVRYLVSQPWPFPSSLMIGCLGEATSEAVTLDRDELEDGRWFHRDEVRSMLDRTHPDGLATPPPMAIAHHLMRHFAEG